MHALGDVDERTARPHGRVQRGELVVAGGDDGAEVLLEELGVLAQSGVGVHEDDTLLLEVFADLVVDHLGLVLRGHAGDETLTLGLGDAELLVGVADLLRKVFPGLGLLLGRAHEVFDVVEVDLAEIGAPGGHGLAAEELVALEARLQHPLRLGLQGGDAADDVLVDPALRERTRGIGVVPAELVLPQAFELGSVDEYIGHGGHSPSRASTVSSVPAFRTPVEVPGMSLVGPLEGAGGAPRLSVVRNA